MGSGIAHVCALAGFDVALNDVERGARQGRHRHHQRQHGAPGRQAADHRRRASGGARAHPPVASPRRPRGPRPRHRGGDRERRGQAQDPRRAVPALKPSAIIATNTSSISITRLAASTDRPEHFIGLHFMNPVPVMQLVEVIRGIATDDATFQAAKAFVAQARQDDRGRRGFPRLHRQPHPAADDQRGDLHAV